MGSESRSDVAWAVSEACAPKVSSRNKSSNIRELTGVAKELNRERFHSRRAVPSPLACVW